MIFSMRWFGENDPVGLEKIRQIPGIQGVVSSLFNIPSSRVIPLRELKRLKKNINSLGLSFDVIESIPVHENIKLGMPDRDKYIDIWIKSMKNCAEAGIPVICYNFMLAFDWIRTDLHEKLPDGSYCMSYDHELLDTFDFTKERIAWANTYTKESLEKTMDACRKIDREKQWDNLVYFLRKVIPEAESLGIKLAMHPDDPPWNVFGIGRIIGNDSGIRRLIESVPGKSNGLTICTGSLGVDPDNDIPSLIYNFRENIHFMHVRNIKITAPKQYHEVSHLSSEGSIDIFEVMKALNEINYSGPIRPDHGRDLWNEKGITGYGFFDRTIGMSYLQGIWETLQKCSKNSVFIS